MTSYTITAPAIEYYRDALEQVEQGLDGLMDEQTQRRTHGEVESRVQTEGGELLRRMLQGYFDQRAAEEPVREGVVRRGWAREAPSPGGLQAAPGDPLRGGGGDPPGLGCAGSGQCLSSGRGAEPAAG
jgi:hypothetical protein